MGNIGWTGIIIIAILVVILFGKGKISSIMGDLAKGIKSFKKGMSDDNSVDDSSNKNSESTIPILANKLKTTGNWKLIPKAKINLIINERYSLTFASSCMGKVELEPIVSNDKKNFIARGMTK